MLPKAGDPLDDIALLQAGRTRAIEIAKQVMFSPSAAEDFVAFVFLAEAYRRFFGSNLAHYEAFIRLISDFSPRAIGVHLEQAPPKSGTVQ